MRSDSSADVNATAPQLRHHVTARLRLRGNLDRRALRASLKRIVARHEILRIANLTKDRRPEIVAAADCDFTLVEQQADSAQSLEQICLNEAREPFDLARGPLSRGRLLQLSANDYVLALTQHHLVADDWSMALLIRELIGLYRLLALGRSNAPDPLQAETAQQAAWARALNPAQLDAEPTRLLADRMRSGLDPCTDQLLAVKLPRALTERLRKLARERHVSMRATLLSLWSVLMARWSGQREVVIGIRIANRGRPQVDAVLAPLQTTIPVRISVDEKATLEGLLTLVQVTLDATREQTAPLATRGYVLPIVTQLDDMPGPILHPADFLLPRLQICDVSIGNVVEGCELALSLSDIQGSLCGRLEYASSLFESETIQRLLASWLVLLKGAVKHPRRRIAHLPLLTGAERKRVLCAFNDTAVAYPQERLVSELFEEQVQRTPEAIAAVCGRQSVTYAELNRRANQLARYLKKIGVAPGEYVPVLMSRSLAMLVAQLAVLKSGAVYVPIDPALPADRQMFMIEDCAARRILADRPRCVQCVDSVNWVNCADQAAAVADCSGHNLERQVAASVPAYVMYTSGSTGNPKGVIVPHHAVVKLVINPGYVSLDTTDCVAHCSNPAFDASTFEIWAPLLNGARVLIVPQADVLDPERLRDVLREGHVTVLWLTVGLFTNYAATLAEIFRGLRYLITGGDVVDPQIARRVLRSGPPLHLLNAYGPTECTTFSTIYEISESDQPARPLPIGRPIANTRIYILDRELHPVPIGVAGEICIGGAGVAAGYLHRPELTAEKFIPDSFVTDPAARLYRSGDLGRWRADGNIEFLGRNDQQLKIRGFRIEPGEIEARLLQHPRVKEAIVLSRENAPGSRQLVAYVTLANARGPGTDELRAHLRSALPDYMIPSAIVILERLPLTENGKVDRRALPAPQLDAFASHSYEPPDGELEKMLAEAWQELLHIERVGRLDNFFELGGHSLLIVHLLERLRGAGFSMHARSVYESRTLADLASTLIRPDVTDRAPPNLIPEDCHAITPQMVTLAQLGPEHIERIVRAIPGGTSNVQDIYPLAALQEGILFHHILANHSTDTYVFSMLFSFCRRTQLQDFIAALQQVIDRHDVLRTAVLWEHLPRPVQVVQRRAFLPVEDLLVAENCNVIEELDRRMQPGQYRLDLRQAPLMRLQVVRVTGSERWYALLRLHHLLCDQQSLETLLGEVKACLEGKASELPVPVPYREHVAQALLGGASPESADFFRSRLGDVEEPTAPFGLLTVQGGSPIDECSHTLESHIAGRIRDQARRLCTSPATLFHAAWALVIAHTTGRDDVVFGTVLSGRLQSAAGAQRIVGMFINTLPLRLRLADLTAEALVGNMQRELTELLAHEQAPLAVAQQSSGVAASLPLFTSLLNYQRSSMRLETEQIEIVPGIQCQGMRSRTNYPVALNVEDQGDRFVLRAKTEKPVNPARLTGYALTALESLLEGLERGTRTPVLSLAILPGHERQQILDSFNRTTEPYPSEALLHELFEEQVARVPHATAVEHGARTISYQELNDRANQLARHLRAHGAGPDERVALCMHRSVELLVALLGVLKAGAAYVPLDPGNPADRLQHILRDAEPLALLTQAALRSTLPPSSAPVISIDEDWQVIAQQRTDNLDPHSLGLKSHHLAYVIYTSGSTGTPKGVMVEHRNIVNYALHALRQFDIEGGDGSLVGTSISFDLMLTGLYPTWLGGRTVRLCPDEHGLPALIPAVAACRNLAPLKLTPSHLSLLEPALDAGQLIGRIRVLVAGGEPLSSDAVKRWRRHAPGTRIFNHYGPTEATVGCIAGEALDLSESTVPLGRPIANTQIYILDRWLNPVPIGVAGEIHIAGAGVTRGYLNRPQLSAERFLRDPFSTDPRARMYKTGDLGRWRADGLVEYLGRNDDQVKVRGFRIEPGEIESQLRGHEQIKDAAVIARDDGRGGRRLVAYVTLRGPADAAANLARVDAFRAYLQRRLPEFMVPSFFVVLQQLPLTANGKLDRRALPSPPAGTSMRNSHEPPRGEIEEIIAAIWQELLAVERIDRRDHFFELGGHSLLAMQVVVRLQSMLPIRLPMRALFEHPTLERLAARVQELNPACLGDDPAEEGADMEDLIKHVATMPDSEVQALMQKLTGVRP